jgi:hypothetical protein
VASTGSGLLAWRNCRSKAAPGLSPKEDIMWYAAHVIMYFKFKDGVQDSFTVYENIFLVEASSTDEGFQKAARFAEADEGDDHASLTCDGRPATRTFAGIRKLVQVDGGMADLDDRPVDGAEVTYSVFEVKNEKALKRLVAGKAVTVRYRE